MTSMKRSRTNEKKRGYIVITADKGLAGAYNHNVIKMAHELFTQGENNKLFVVGELGRQYFAKEGLAVDSEFQLYGTEPDHFTVPVSLQIVSWNCMTKDELG